MAPNDIIYLDNGATTPLDPLALEAMLPFLQGSYGNASSLHRLGAEAAAAVQHARETFADALSCDPLEIVFTSGGTEADNLGTRGAALAAPKRRRHALLFALEHPAVRNQTAFLEAQGFEVETLPCDSDGLLAADTVERMLRPDDTALVAVMHANNEIGTVQPIGEIGELLEDMCPDAHFHTDCVQSFSKLSVKPRAMRVDTLALAGHKLHGPKGVGVFYKRKKSKVRPLMAGGGHEGGLRAGTENVPGIVGFAAAARLALSNMIEDAARMTRLRDQLIDRILKTLDGVTVNGHRTRRLCNNANINIAGARAEILLHALEERGIFVSSGSACHAGQTGPSHVLRAIGLTEKDTGSLRITLSRHTTEAEIVACGDALLAVLKQARG